MSEESLETKMAKMEARIKHLEDVADDHHQTMYGSGDHKGGLVNELKDMKSEQKYLRYIYVLATAVALPYINAFFQRMGLPTIKVG